MEAPYTIASLPKPFDTEYGSIQAAPLYGIRGSKKRKRHEVAVGIDGEGVNIYNIQSQVLVTSYPLPSQTYLCCPPCSVYVRRPKPVGAQRRTYIVVRDGPQDAKRRVVCLTEESHRGRLGDDTPSGPTKLERRLQDGDIWSLDVVASQPSGEEGTLQVIVSYRDGVVECLSADLSKVMWRHAGGDSSGTDGTIDDVEYIGLTNLEIAQKGLLAAHEDVSAAHATSGSSSSNHQLLCRVIRSDIKRRLQLFSLRATAANAVQSQKPAMQLLLSYEIPGKAGQISADYAVFDVHAASGKAYQLLNGRLKVYDLSGTIPRLLTTFGSNAEPVSTFERASACSVLAVQSDKAVVYETRYGSVQASAALRANEISAAAGQKRKRIAEDDVPQAAWSAISNFQDLGLVVGLSGTELMAIQLSEDTRHAKRSKSDRTLLVDVLGKDAAMDPAKLTGNVVKDEKKAKKWEAWKARVDAAVEADDSSELEQLVYAALRPKQGRGQPTESNGELLDVDGEADPVALDLDSDTFDVSAIDRRKVLYLLSKVFHARTLAETERGQTAGLISATVQSDLVYKWLALTGLVTLPYIRQALRSHGQTLRPGDIMTALADFDGTFELVHDLLGMRTYWELPELVQALRLLIQSLGNPPPGTTTKVLPAPPSQRNGDTEMVNGTAESHLESESARAERELDMAVAALTNGLELRSETLRMVLDRLTAFPQSSVTKTMRAMMRHEELLFFMKILRIELLEGGWQKKYVRTEGESEEDAADFGGIKGYAPKNHAIGHISFLMSCAIDAVGLSGWLVGQSGEVEGTGEFMGDLKGEVSACLEGLFEYDTLGLFLDEVERYRNSGSGKSRAARVKDVEREGGVLPMGCRVEVPAVTGLGKRREKSARVFEAERRKGVGRYAFERIRV